jgi:AcrR family transcriptional regulator
MAADSQGSGDPARTMALLWGLEKKASRGPKPALSIDRIAQAAIDVADAEGIEALSMQRLAERLGYSTMSLYRYVPGKAELIAVMLDVAAGSPPALDAAAEGWRRALERWAKELLAIYTRRPWILRVALSSPPLGPNRSGWMEAGLRALSATALTQREVLATVTLVEGYVRSAARFAIDLAQAEQHTGVAAGAWGMAYGQLLGQVIDADRFPTLCALVASGVFDRPEDTPDDEFEFGLQRLLDGIEILVRRRAAQPEPL